MNKQEALKQIEELKAYIERLDKNQEIILVPDNIKIEKVGCGDRLAIRFANNQQILCLGEYGFYSVIMTDERNLIKCKIIPCLRSDLKAGDTAYYTDDDDTTFDDLTNYCKILDDKRYVSIDHEDVCVYISPYDYWYKVVPVEDE